MSAWSLVKYLHMVRLNLLGHTPLLFLSGFRRGVMLWEQQSLLPVRRTIRKCCNQFQRCRVPPLGNLEQTSSGAHFFGQFGFN